MTVDEQRSGVRVVLDARPAQGPDRAPVTALYLDCLLEAYDSEPLSGESFALLLQSDLDDPTVRHRGLEVVGRRLLPPTRLLRGAAMTLDPFLLRGAILGAAWRADRGGAAGAVYHAVGGGNLPIAADLPVVVTLLDLAPWEMPGAFQRGPTARFGQRLRARLLRDAASVIVGSQAVAAAARRLLRIRRDRLRVIPPAPRSAFRAIGAGEARPGPLVSLAPPSRYIVGACRYDARSDLGTYLRALAGLRRGGSRSRRSRGTDDGPPRTVLVGVRPADGGLVLRAAERHGVADLVELAPPLTETEHASLVSGARAVVVPVASDAVGLAAVEAIATGTPVVAPAVGALPEVIGTAGIIVEPRDPDRLAAALATVWADDRVHARLAGVAAERARSARWNWADVARATRSVYAEVARPGVARSSTS